MPGAKAAAKPKYDVHPGVAMMRKWADELLGLYRMPIRDVPSLDQFVNRPSSAGCGERALQTDNAQAATRLQPLVGLYAVNF